MSSDSDSNEEDETDRPENGQVGNTNPMITKKRHSYDAKFKLEAIQFAETNSNLASAKKFGVARTQIQNWGKQRNVIGNLNNEGTSKRKRLKGAGRKPACEILEEHLIQWIKAERAEKRRISRKRIKLQALAIHGELLQQNTIGTAEKFVASNGWLFNFVKRNNLTLRRATTTSQKTPASYIPKIVDFVLFVRKQKIAKGYPRGAIYGCDETAVWMDCPGDTTVKIRGAKEVPIRATGHEKSRLTVMLCARNNGEKCKPFVLLNRKRPLPELNQQFKNKLTICYAGKNCMDNTLTLEFMGDCFGKLAFSRRLLVWDSFRCHISEDIKSYLRKIKVDSAVIPGGCTKYIQPADVCWNQPFKAKIRDLYDEWLANGNFDYTSGGNIKQASLETACSWICTAWDSLSADPIRKSFVCCGINATDGSEDSLINCLKEGKSCEEGYQLLQNKNRQLQEELEVAPLVEHEVVQPPFGLEDEAEESDNYDSDQDEIVYDG